MLNGFLNVMYLYDGMLLAIIRSEDLASIQWRDFEIMTLREGRQLLRSTCCDSVCSNCPRKANFSRHKIVQQLPGDGGAQDGWEVMMDGI